MSFSVKNFRKDYVPFVCRTCASYAASIVLKLAFNVDYCEQ